MGRVSHIIALLFLWCFATGQNNLLRGFVKLQSSGSSPLGGVEISAFGAQTVYSNDAGMFEMRFTGKKQGAAVSLMVSKPGYEVINSRELERCILRSSPDDLVYIIMARQGDRQRQALAYYNIIVDNTHEQFGRQLESIRAQLDRSETDNAERKTLIAQIAALQEEKEALLLKAESLAEQLSGVDLDGASALAREAYEKFETGDIESALDILSDDILDRNLQATKEAVTGIKADLQKAENALDQSIENYMIKARFCLINNQYQEAKSAFNKAIDADPFNKENIVEVAEFYDEIYDQVNALAYYEMALAVAESRTDSVDLFVEIGDQLRYDNRYEEARQTYLRAESSLQGDAIQSLRLMISFGILEMELNHLDSALHLFQKAIVLSDHLADSLMTKAPQSMDLRFDLFRADLFFNMGTVYARQEYFSQAESALKKALTIYDSTDLVYPGKTKYDRSLVMLNLGGIYGSHGKLDEAMRLFLAANEILKELSIEVPQKYLPELARNSNHMGAVSRDMDDHDASVQFLVNSMEIYEDLVKNNPGRFYPSLARTYTNLGGVYHDMADYPSSDRYLVKAMHIRRQLSEQNPEKHDLDYCRSVLNVLGLKRTLLESTCDSVYRDEGLELLALVRRTFEDYTFLYPESLDVPAVMRIDEGINYFDSFFTGMTSEVLACQVYINKGDSILQSLTPAAPAKEKIAAYRKAIHICQTGLDRFPDNQRLKSHTARLYGSYAWTLLLDRKFEKALEAGHEGLEMDKDSKWLKSYLAAVYLLNDDFKAAIALYNELKDQPDGNATYRETFLSDLDALNAAGILHDNINKARHFLGGD